MAETILQVNNLVKHFYQNKGALSLISKRRHVIPAVDDISFSMEENQTLGLVGESGCGKTTTGKTIINLNSVTSGEVIYKGSEISNLSQRQFRPYRKEMQMIFQDLDAALNPKMKIRSILAESIKVHHRELNPEKISQRIEELLDLVNIKKNKLSQYPSELSGGEKRRIGIARVLAVGPKFIVADEPTSALDVSIQAQVVNLMLDLQRDLKLSYLFISHDLQLVELISHKVAVMYLGKIVEFGAATEVAKKPLHPYTSILWTSLVNRQSYEAIQDRGGPAKPAHNMDYAKPISGCRFAPRCPIYEQRGYPAECTDPENEPKLSKVGDSRKVACHFPL